MGFRQIRVTTLTTQSKSNLKDKYMIAAHSSTLYICSSAYFAYHCGYVLRVTRLGSCNQNSVNITFQWHSEQTVGMSGDIQLDKLTDVSNATLLLVFVSCYRHSSLHDNLMFYKEFPTRTMADNVISCLDDYFTEKGLARMVLHQWQEWVMVLSNRSKKGCQTPSEYSIAYLGKVTQQSRCHQNCKNS